MQFHIDSAFLTDIARSWFWNEKMPYKKSEELLMCCLNTDKLSLEEKKAICKDVIEGRKKFVGIDECQIVDDGKNVRTIDEELKIILVTTLLPLLRQILRVTHSNTSTHFPLIAAILNLLKKSKAAKSKTLSATSKIIFSLTMR